MDSSTKMFLKNCTFINSKNGEIQNNDGFLSEIQQQQEDQEQIISISKIYEFPISKLTMIYSNKLESDLINFQEQKKLNKKLIREYKSKIKQIELENQDIELAEDEIIKIKDNSKTNYQPIVQENISEVQPEIQDQSKDPIQRDPSISESSQNSIESQESFDTINNELLELSLNYISDYLNNQPLSKNTDEFNNLDEMIEIVD
ncbi:hypothetical protein BN7_1636 [Wickerhamomyces ciferrii]|uniref:Uncharacterized protein n=1 Tax=Wickerhamomyces ciferrii (strain ATCC 14091 / BCRC 22168 / CBS 111 / JCM 3599 / NBRC 0793 / NRRL Y-1031 F-60-10) TaxID=1206466 RepID=K0KKW0_WICCF|nr:uncharacterized protein BN7_1636 [Wickerhamomyces ciferrii]CCH42094.1 hypothetical protein BN7_1636 [Wickerhamomyces ciferrii]